MDDGGRNGEPKDEYKTVKRVSAMEIQAVGVHRTWIIMMSDDVCVDVVEVSTWCRQVDNVRGIRTQRTRRGVEEGASGKDFNVSDAVFLLKLVGDMLDQSSGKEGRV